MGDDSTRGDESSSTAAQSERQAVEFRLLERERFLRTLISNLPGIVYRCRTDEHWTPPQHAAGVLNHTPGSRTS